MKIRHKFLVTFLVLTFCINLFYIPAHGAEIPISSKNTSFTSSQRTVYLLNEHGTLSSNSSNLQFTIKVPKNSTYTVTVGAGPTSGGTGKVLVTFQNSKGEFLIFQNLSATSYQKRFNLSVGTYTLTFTPTSGPSYYVATIYETFS